MARRDLTGAVNFRYLEDYTANDAAVIDEVLALFREQAQIWSAMLDPQSEGWRDAVHTLKGAARGVGAFALGDACEAAEREGPDGLPAVRDALDAALADVAAYAHERALQSLKTPRG
jgi:HPt (histidine-containing phosphotransfer) domain-containing protein